MAKEEKNNSSVQKKMKDFNTFVISNSLQNISGYTEDHLNDFKYIHIFYSNSFNWRVCIN